MFSVIKKEECKEIIKYKDRMCESFINCKDCPLDNTDCDILERVGEMQELVEVVGEWAKENPIKTNMEKFEEVFGIKILAEFHCPFYSTAYCRGSEFCADCKYYHFWRQEYKAPQDGENE